MQNYVYYLCGEKINTRDKSCNSTRTFYVFSCILALNRNFKKDKRVAKHTHNFFSYNECVIAGILMDKWYSSLFVAQKGFPGSDGKESACLPSGRPRFNSWVGKIAWRRAWLLTAVF